MHITLINPAVPKLQIDSSCAQLPPLGLLYIAAYLEEHGHTVNIIDAELFCYTPEEVLAHIPDNAEIIGITGTTFQCEQAFSIANIIRSQRENCTIIMGGPHASAVQYQIFEQCLAIDYVILGCGEIPLLDFAMGKKPESIIGCIARGTLAVENPPFAEMLPFESLPLPARHLVPIKAYTGAGKLPFVQTSMMLTRGCPFNCMFCSSTVFGKRWDRRDVPDIINELKIISKMGFSEVFFQDDTINVNINWATELFKAIINSQFELTFKLSLRANEKMLPESLVKLMAQAGVEHVFFGVESANDEIRNNVSKGITKEEVRRAVALSKKYNLRVTLAFIVGLPGETEGTVEESIEFVKELRPFEAGFSIATAFPGSALRAWAIENNYLETQCTNSMYSGKSSMRTEALTCAQLDVLRKKADSETIAFTEKSDVSSVELMKHLLTIYTRYNRLDGYEIPLAFVQLAIMRTTLDIHLGHEPCIRVTHRLIGYNISKYITAKAQAFLGNAYYLFNLKDESLEFFYAAELAGFHDITSWCNNRYKELGLGDGYFLGYNYVKADPPTCIRNLLEANIFFKDEDVTYAALDPYNQLSVHSNLFSIHEQTVDGFLSRATSIQMEQPKVFWLLNVASLLHNEIDIINFFQKIIKYVDANTIIICQDNFGFSASDKLPGKDKRSSRTAFIKNMEKFGLYDTSSVDGFNMLYSSILNNEELQLDNFIFMRVLPSFVEFRHFVLNSRDIFKSKYTSICLECKDAVQGLITNQNFNFILRYEAALLYNMEDALYAVFNTSCLNFGLWKKDFTRMIATALNLKGKKLLDFGCAYGGHVLGYRYNGVEAYGVDVNTKFIADAPTFIRKYLRNAPIDKPKDIFSFFPHNSMDAIVANEVFEHMSYAAKETWVRIFYKMLKPGGYCVINCPTGEQHFQDIYGVGVFCDPQHTGLLTVKQMEQLFVESGFVVKSEEYSAFVRDFLGSDGFSFYQVYTPSSTYFCFKKGENNSIEPEKIWKSRFISLYSKIMYKLYQFRIYSLFINKIKKIAKKIFRKINSAVVFILPVKIKEEMKKATIIKKFISYLKRS